MSKATKAFNIVFAIFVALAAVILAVCWWANKYGNLPTATTTAYINTITDRHGVEYPFIEVNHFANVTATGEHVVFEMQFNFYTDPEGYDVRSLGVQEIRSGANKTRYFYSKDAYGAYADGPALNSGIPMYFEIDGERYFIALGETYKVYTEKFTWKKFGSDFKSIFSKNPTNLGNFAMSPTIEERQLSFDIFLDEVRGQMVKTSHGYGDYVLPMLDLANYFSLNKYDESNGQFKEMPYTSFNASFFQVNVHNDRAGMVSAKQSLFGMVKNDAGYSYKSAGQGADYWQFETVRTLTLADFDSRYSEIEGGLLLTLNERRRAEAKAAPVDVVYIIDLDVRGADVIGLDLFALNGVEIELFSVRGYMGSEFIFCEYSLYGAEIGRIESIGANLIYRDGARPAGVAA